ncbi:MAG TPA: tetratricopeptide repeat protein [Polyangia bacterium]|jgi:Tfp pilus assembly protein PilF
MLAFAGCATRPKRDLDQSQIHYQLAADSFRNRRIEAAMDELQKALSMDPENADAMNLLGLINLQQGSEYVAQAETENCLRGADEETVRQQANAKFRQAEQELRKATTLRPKFSEAWNNLAVAGLSLKDFDLAATAARNALKDVTYPEPEVARANLGWALFQAKDNEGAWRELHEAAARSPGFCVGRYRLAKLYVERSDYERASEELDAVTSSATCPIQEAFLLSGLVHERRKDAAGARALFGRCAELAPRGCLAAQCKRYAEMLQ